MIKVDGSLFVQIANFLVLIWLLNIILYKPIRNVLIKRNEKVKGLEQNIDMFKRDAQEREDTFANGIKAARVKGLKEKDALLATASEEERNIIAEINQKAQTNLAEVRAKIAKDTEAVRKSLQQEIDEFASAIGKKILGRTV
ncbi:ATPase [Desulfobacteraceae bacterium SEEP-SAG9]|nr:ATPase [Desulfobacteraceae bacterium SEEP-SAG9]